MTARVGNPLLERLLYWLRLELRDAHAGEHDVVLFGSVVLYLHGLRKEIGDVDVFVTRPVWDRLERSFGRARGGVCESVGCGGGPTWARREPHPDDPPFLASRTAPPVSAFYDWTKRDNWIDVADCFGRAELVEGWRCIPLELVREHKRNAGAVLGFDGPRAKHVDDLRVLDALLG